MKKLVCRLQQLPLKSATSWWDGVVRHHHRICCLFQLTKQLLVARVSFFKLWKGNSLIRKKSLLIFSYCLQFKCCPRMHLHHVAIQIRRPLAAVVFIISQPVVRIKCWHCRTRCLGRRMHCFAARNFWRLPPCIFRASFSFSCTFGYSTTSRERIQDLAHRVFKRWLSLFFVEFWVCSGVGGWNWNDKIQVIAT